jgi:hypothetical protein
MTRLATWPVALLTTACATRPWTSATLVEYRGEPVPESSSVELPPRQEAMERWLLPVEQPWASWTKATLLSALDEQPPAFPQRLPDVRSLRVVADAERAAFALARAGIPPGSLWIMDLRGAASVAFGATLSDYVRVAPVLTFNNWPAEDEVIPAEETLAALLSYTPRLPAGPEPATPVFLLDAWRLAYRDESVDDDATDNRYGLLDQDFPSAAQLTELGIRRVVYVVESLQPTTVEEDDLHATFTEWAEQGIELSMIDLTALAGELPLERYVLEHRYRPVPRVTILEDDWMNVRSPGGFGGYEGSTRLVTGPSYFGRAGHWGSGG